MPNREPISQDEKDHRERVVIGFLLAVTLGVPGFQAVKGFLDKDQSNARPAQVTPAPDLTGLTFGETVKAYGGYGNVRHDGTIEKPTSTTPGVIVREATNQKMVVDLPRTANLPHKIITFTCTAGNSLYVQFNDSQLSLPFQGYTAACNNGKIVDPLTMEVLKFSILTPETNRD